WPGNNEQMVRYHDEEWGVPCHDDRKLFEYIVLDTFQAGLSWAIVLKKREGFRQAFENFDPTKIASYVINDVQRLENNPEIIRNKLKIAATVTNAQAFLKIQKEFGSFDKYIWGFVYSEQSRGVKGRAFDSAQAKPIVNSPKEDSHIAASSEESDAMSIDLKKRGFKFVGTTICYAFMQGAGLVNDHTVNCFRYNELTNGN
ncbi:MAG: DNA-3-methyladenine glycosylase I, partial [Patescibacteria group bacterium]